MNLLYRGLPVALRSTPERGMLMASSIIGYLLVAMVSLQHPLGQYPFLASPGWHHVVCAGDVGRRRDPGLTLAQSGELGELRYSFTDIMASMPPYYALRLAAGLMFLADAILMAVNLFPSG